MTAAHQANFASINTAPRRSPPRWAISLAGWTTPVILFAAVSIELSTERYGAPALAESVPGFGLLATTAQLGSVGLLIIWAVISATTQSRGQSQVAVWIPFLMVWVAAAFFGSSQQVPPPHVWLSAVLVLIGVLMGSVLSYHPGGTRWIALLGSRLLIWPSLVVAVLVPNRAFAPYAVWPGGWFEGVDRLQGILPHPNTLGWVAAVGVVVEIFATRSPLRILWAAPPAVALMLTGSRTATLVLAVGFIVVVAAAVWRWAAVSRILALAAVALVAGLGVWVVNSPSFDLGTLNGRVVTWEHAFAAFQSSPLIGIGPGAAFEGGGAYAHNQILQVMAEMGILGLIALAIHVSALARIVFRSQRLYLAICIVAMWVFSFATENMLRIASANFVPTILLFQLALYMAGDKRHPGSFSEASTR